MDGRSSGQSYINTAREFDIISRLVRFLYRTFPVENESAKFKFTNQKSEIPSNLFIIESLYNLLSIQSIYVYFYRKNIKNLPVIFIIYRYPLLAYLRCWQPHFYRHHNGWEELSVNS